MRPLVLVLCVLPAFSAFSSAFLTEVPLNERDWTLSHTGKFEAWVDQRELLVLHHPWEESNTGAEASASRDLVVPEGFSGPVRLHFYLSDDYDGQAALYPEDWRGKIALPGHRFKQVWLNETLVWERDVADAEGVSETTRFSVPLPESLQSGQSFRLTFKLVDKVGSAERLPGDERVIGTTDSITEQEPWRFMTHLYVGDVMLSPLSLAQATVPERASLLAVRERAQSHKPDFPARSSASLPVQLNVAGALGGSFPRVLHCGVPLAKGLVASERLKNLRLHRPDGGALECRFSPMNYWEDGSIRWVELQTVTDGVSQQLMLSLNDGGEAVPPKQASPTDWTLCDPNDTQAARFQVGGHDLEFCAVFEANGQTYRSKPDKTGASFDTLSGHVETRGVIAAGAATLGRYECSIEMYRDAPYARIQWRYYPENTGTSGVTRMWLELKHSGLGPAQVSWRADGSPQAPPLTLRQTGPEQYQVSTTADAVLDSGTKSAGWLGLNDGTRSMCVLLRHFAQQHPAQLSFSGNTLAIGLFEGNPDTPAYVPHEGEAKRHELWVGVWDRGLSPGELAEVAAHFSEPPHLMNAAYFCATGAMGRAFPHDEQHFPELTAFMRTTYQALGDEAFSATGVRHWGDFLYNADKQQWRNGYYDTPQGYAVEYAMTGDARWFRRLEASARHIADVDCCHASKEHPEWEGGIHGYDGPDHSTEAPWPPTQRIKGLLAYAHITADDFVRRDALAVADSALRSGRALGAVSVRDHAGVLDALVAAYDETRNPKYLEGARRLAHDAMTRIDARRGCYSEIHGNVSYRGNVPWMVAQLAEPMFEYYELSGDLQAALTVVRLSESIVSENRTRDIPGDVWGYSHNPHFKKTSNYHVLIAPILCYAFELTGDEGFMAHARAMYEQSIRENTVNPVTNCYWDTPALLYYLTEYTP